MDIRNPKYVNADHTRIDCEIDWQDDGDWQPFTADPNDAALHSSAIWSALLSGIAGEVAEYIEPVQTTFTQEPFRLVAQLLGSGVLDGELIPGDTFNIIAGMRMDIGQFYFLYEEATPGNCKVSGTTPIRVIEQDETGFLIETLDGNGNPYDPVAFDLSVFCR